MTTAVIVVLVLLVAFMLFGVPVGFAIGGATMAAMWFCSDLNMVVNAQYCYSGIFSFTVMAIPFFMLAGVIMSTGGIARRIVDFASALIGFVTGSLGCVTILACMFFGALCGSGMATASAIGSTMCRMPPRWCALRPLWGRLSRRAFPLYSMVRPRKPRCPICSGPAFCPAS